MKFRAAIPSGDLVPVPSVSVVVPGRNGGKFLEPCLRSLLAQKYPCAAYEILVVENAPTDDTTTIAKRFGRVAAYDRTQEKK